MIGDEFSTRIEYWFMIGILIYEIASWYPVFIYINNWLENLDKFGSDDF